MKLTALQLEHYRRNILLSEIGEAGQLKLLNSKVLIIGAGGLGSPNILYLAAAGVGTLGIADFDNLDWSNLQRQVIHSTSSLGESKAQSAAARVKALNPDVKVVLHQERLTAENLPDIIETYDFILDCTDNFDSKFIINDACVLKKTAFCHAGVHRFQGQVMTYVPGQGPCYRCIFEEVPPPNEVIQASQVGVIGAICGVIGSIQAMEAIKFLLGIGNLLTCKLYTMDILTMHSHIVNLPKEHPLCPVCKQVNN